MRKYDHCIRCMYKNVHRALPRGSVLQYGACFETLGLNSALWHALTYFSRDKKIL